MADAVRVLPRFRLGVLTAVWGRPAVTAAALRHYAGLRVPGVDLVPLAVASPEDPDGLFRREHLWRPDPDAVAWAVTYAPNAPLSDKWNAGMMALEAYNVGAVTVVGSDDLLTAAYLARAAQEVRRGADLVLFDTLHAYETATGRGWVGRPNRLGGGRTLSRRLLDAARWAPWPPGLDRRLDGGMDRRLRAGRLPRRDALVRAADTPGAVLLSLKSDVNLWGFEALTQWGGEPLTARQARTLLRTHFPHVTLPTMAKKKTTKKGAEPKAEPKAKGAAAKGTAAKGGDGPVRLRALVNVPRHLLPDGHARVYAGGTFEAPSAAAARDLQRRGVAEAA